MRRVEEREYEQSADRQYWLALIKRVHSSAAGLQGLRPAEKTYFAVSCLIGEVYNGGFDQFFSNSTGALYAYALDGLLEMEAEKSAALLAQAKEAIFGCAPVPLEQGARNLVMRQSSDGAHVEALDKAFWQDSEDLSVRCRKYAATHALFADT